MALLQNFIRLAKTIIFVRTPSRENLCPRSVAQISVLQYLKEQPFGNVRFVSSCLVTRKIMRERKNSKKTYLYIIKITLAQHRVFALVLCVISPPLTRLTKRASCFVFDNIEREQGWRGDGAVVRALASHQCGPGTTPGPGARFSKLPITFRARKLF